jgi:hypothetical protein
VILDRVTLTGPDESVSPESLIPLSREFPYAEWGILFSKSRFDCPRYPGREWARKLAGLAKATPGGMKLSAHLCGGLVRDLLKGKNTLLAEHPDIWNVFQRVQINFHAEPHVAEDALFEALRESPGKQYILQMDGVNDDIFWKARSRGVNAVPLFDQSHGAGVEPDKWPMAYAKTYCGYAGGLGPRNLGAQLEAISAAAGDERVWVDMETRVRSPDDRRFDLVLVKACLEVARPFVTEEVPG